MSLNFRAFMYLCIYSFIHLFIYLFIYILQMVGCRLSSCITVRYYVTVRQNQELQKTLYFDIYIL